MIQNTGEIRICALIFIFFLLLCTCTVSAVVLPQQADEVQSLQIETTVMSSGTFQQTSSIEWQQSSELLGVNLVERGDVIPVAVFEPEPPLHPGGEVQSYVTYSEDTQANMGTISFDKSTDVDTRSKAVGLYNVENERQITFTGIDAGSLLSSEDMTMYNVGNCTRTPSICPFSGGEEVPNPSFCSLIETGSDLSMSKVAVFTSTGVRNVNMPISSIDGAFNWPPIPNADYPAMAYYTIQVNELGSGIPSEGSVLAFLHVSEKDGRSELSGCPSPYQIVEVEDSTSIEGSISLFEKIMNYESGMNT
jgi:hypothetical protein